MFATATEVMTVKAELNSSISPIEAKANQLVVVTADDYRAADELLQRIATAENSVEEKLNPIIRPMYEALEKLYALKRELVNPLKAATNIVKSKMKLYKDAERRALEDERRRRAEEESRLLREAAEKSRLEQSAATAAMRIRLATKRLELEQQAEEIAAAPKAEPIKVGGSTTKVVKKVVVKDYTALLKGAAEGKVDLQVFEINQTFLNAAFRKMPAEVSQWPGIEIKEETEITRR